MNFLYCEKLGILSLIKDYAKGNKKHNKNIIRVMLITYMIFFLSQEGYCSEGLIIPLIQI